MKSSTVVGVAAADSSFTADVVVTGTSSSSPAVVGVGDAPAGVFPTVEPVTVTGTSSLTFSVVVGDAPAGALVDSSIGVS